jgi:hypothetical protein
MGGLHRKGGRAKLVNYANSWIRRRSFLAPLGQNLRISAIFSNWHAPCNVYGVIGMVRITRTTGIIIMYQFHDYGRRLAAAFGAFAFSAMALTLAIAPSESASPVWGSGFENAVQIQSEYVA